MNYAEIRAADATLESAVQAWMAELGRLRELAEATMEALDAVARKVMRPHAGSPADHVGPLVSDYATELAPLLDSLGFQLVPSATLVGRHTIEPKE